MSDNIGTDRDYLLNKQYKDSSNLQTRVQLHRRFSTNTYGWHRWMFDYLSLIPSNARVLEVGCGPCDLWLQNLTRIPAEWSIVLSDFSPGMIRQAKNLLLGRAERFTFHQFDAQQIPYEDDEFDAVIANHMLYHVPDLDQTLSEIRRVLKSDGQLFAATNGLNNMSQLRILHDKFLRQQKQTNGYEGGTDSTWLLPFNLQNGEELLRPYFSQIIVRHYGDSLRVTAMRPLYDYMMSSTTFGLKEELQNEFYAFLQEEFSNAGGVLEAEKEIGMFVAQPRGTSSGG